MFETKVGLHWSYLFHILHVTSGYLKVVYLLSNSVTNLYEVKATTEESTSKISTLYLFVYVGLLFSIV